MNNKLIIIAKEIKDLRNKLVDDRTMNNMESYANGDYYRTKVRNKIFIKRIANLSKEFNEQIRCADIFSIAEFDIWAHSYAH